ncbi:MAG: ribosomal protein S18-alanine N-acetyltransferase [Nodosilinea sp.]
MGQLYCLAPTPADIPALVDLDQRALGGLWSASGYSRELDSPNSCLRMVIRGGEPTVHPKAAGRNDPSTDPMAPMADREILGLGCYWAILDEAHITLLGIDPRYQRRGLGQWLLVHLLEDAYQRPLTRATLEVRAANSRAIALYQSFGFEILGRRRRYYPDGEDALILWQNSLSTPEFQTDLTRRHRAAANRLKGQGWQVMTEKQWANRT